MRFVSCSHCIILERKGIKEGEWMTVGSLTSSVGGAGKAGVAQIFALQ